MGGWRACPMQPPSSRQVGAVQSGAMSFFNFLEWTCFSRVLPATPNMNLQAGASQECALPLGSTVRSQQLTAPCLLSLRLQIINR